MQIIPNWIMLKIICSNNYEVKSDLLIVFVTEISTDTLTKVMENVVKRAQTCKWEEGGRLADIIFRT